MPAVTSGPPGKGATQYWDVLCTPQGLFKIDVLPLEDFQFFPKLATELRLKIWKHSLPGPRYLEVVRLETEKKTKVRVREAAPVALFVCRESRAVALKKYSVLKVPRIRLDGAFCDFGKDIILFARFSSISALYHIGRVWGHKIHHLAMTQHSWGDLLRENEAFYNISVLILQLSRIKTVQVLQDWRMGEELPPRASVATPEGNSLGIFVCNWDYWYEESKGLKFATREPSLHMKALITFGSINLQIGHSD
ncbi:hypothetical protein B0O99DRAFT_594943 [Bisporella sp. PMI_857]|nr:hypothetical protein B0O99DRAFT_594943 [Bisporella sp. PMI_857]